MRLSAKNSHDPDGHEVHARWYVYREAGTVSAEIPLSALEGVSTSLTIPSDLEEGTIHVILEVQDTGTPKLTAFRRAVVRIAK